MITLEQVKNNEEVKHLILGSQKHLDALGYTEHSIRHISIVSKRAGDILEALRIPKRKDRTCKDSRVFTRYWKLC